MRNHTNTIETIEKSTQYEKIITFRYLMHSTYLISKENNPENFDLIREGIEINFDLGVMRCLYNVKINA